MSRPAGFTHSPETRARMSAALKGRPKSAAHRQAISVAKAGNSPRLIGDLNGRWAGDGVGYTAAHRRVEAVKGLAAQHTCIDCQQQARDWSFKDATGFSIDPDDYEPRCRSCHRTKDSND